MDLFNLARLTSIIIFLLGGCLLISSSTFGENVYAAAIGIHLIENHHTLFLGSQYIFYSLILFYLTTHLENVVKATNHWKLYSLNKDSIIMDVEQEYLKMTDSPSDVSQAQENIEKLVSKSRKWADSQHLNKHHTYEDQFYSGHASQGGRVIDVYSHISSYGPNKGKLIHFNQPANAKYIWVVDEDENFIVANRQTFTHEMGNMNSEKIDMKRRKHKLPHATLARGRKVLGSGELLVEGGLVKSYNTASGHYIDLSNIEGFNKQGAEVFEYFRKKAGWKRIKEK